MTFLDWVTQQYPEQFIPEKQLTLLLEAWRTGQAAERERLQPVIDSLQECHEAMEYMSEYDIPIGLPIRVSTALKIANGGKD